MARAEPRRGGFNRSHREKFNRFIDVLLEACSECQALRARENKVVTMILRADSGHNFAMYVGEPALVALIAVRYPGCGPGRR